MTGDRPTLMFHVSTASAAPPGAVYDLLADPATHLEWAGRRAPRPDFRLLTVDAPPGPLTAGDAFSSTGAANSGGTFHDRSVVVEAMSASSFGFDTEATLERKRAATWRARFTHRYAIAPSATGSVISYRAEVRPVNYVPYWLKPWMRPMTRMMIQRMMRTNLRNLASMAEAAVGTR